MDTQTLLTRINGVFRKVFPGLNEDVTLLTTNKDVKNWDSLNHMKLILMLEDEFSVKIKIGEMVMMTTLDRIVEVLKAKKSIGNEP